MLNILVKFCRPHFDTHVETGKEVTLQLPFAPEKGDYIKVPGIETPCRVVARCFIPDEAAPVLYVIIREELSPVVH